MSGNAPLVSIVTPLFNAEQFIRSTVESVLNQDFKDWEYIIVDDMSEDGGPDIVRSLAAADQRIRFIQLEENGGAAVARNAGIAEARGRYIAFVDSDDMWLPKKLGRQISFMQEHNRPFTFTDYRKIEEDGTETDLVVRCRPKLRYRTQLKTNFVGCSTAVYDSEYYGKRLFPLIRRRQDYGLWLDLLSDGNIGWGITEPLTLYRKRSGGLSSNKLQLISYNWSLYRSILGFDRIRAGYYLMWNIAIKLLFRR